MAKLSKSKKFYRAISFKFSGGGCINIGGGNNKVADHYQKGGTTTYGGSEVKWELRPGGMLVQKRETCSGNSETGSAEPEEMINLRVSTVSQWHHISIQATSTFGELKMILSLVTNLEAREQRLLFKGKEREDKDYLHMVGVRDNDKVLLLEDPAIKERKLHALTTTTCRTISV
ncbi:hypothetical protein ACFE04_007240 [Oxalis oulophora]